MYEIRDPRMPILNFEHSKYKLDRLNKRRKFDKVFPKHLDKNFPVESPLSRYNNIKESKSSKQISIPGPNLAIGMLRDSKDSKFVGDAEMKSDAELAPKEITFENSELWTESSGTHTRGSAAAPVDDMQDFGDFDDDAEQAV